MPDTYSKAQAVRDKAKETNVSTVNIQMLFPESTFLKKIPSLVVRIIFSTQTVKHSKPVLAKVFCKGLGSKYFRLFRPSKLCCNYSTLLQDKSSHRQYVYEWAWLHFDKTLFTKTRCGPALAQRLWLPTAWPKTMFSNLFHMQNVCMAP